MLTIQAINSFLKNILDPKDMSDSALNGIQVETDIEIKKIAFAVDGSLSAIEKSFKENTQLLIVHHGFFWGKTIPIAGNHRKRLKLMLENNLGMIAYHLPLDAHNIYGNNISILKKINGFNSIPFGYYKGTPIGFQGELKSMEIDEICKNLGILIDEKLVRYLDFGKKEINTVAIVSGGGGSCFQEAIEKKIDLFITGDAEHELFHTAVENKTNILFAGHYFTETFGVKSLQNLIETEFSISTCFCDIPTGL